MYANLAADEVLFRAEVDEGLLQGEDVSLVLPPNLRLLRALTR